MNTFEPSEQVKSWSDLRDGHKLWRILQDIDPDFFSGHLPDEGQRLAKDYVLKLQNSAPCKWTHMTCADAKVDFCAVKHIERAAARYIRRHDRLPHTVNKLCPHLDGVAGDEVAQEAPKVKLPMPVERVQCAEFLPQLVMAILLCAMFSPESNKRMVGRIQSLGHEAGIAIATKIGEIEAADTKMGEYFAETNNGIDHDASSTSETLQTSRGPSFEVDMELQKEEKLIQAYKLIEQLQEKNSIMAEELASVRDRHSKLEEELAEHQVLNKSKTVNSDQLDYLLSQADKDKNYIASLESELSTSQAELESKTRQLETLRTKSDSVAELRDQLQIIKAERDELIQHKNANENLKKKIQSLQEQVKNDEFLRQDLASAREQLQEYDTLKDDRDALLKANEEKSKVIANCEQEIFDSKSTKRRLEADIKTALQKYESMKEKHQRDHETMQELQEQVEVSRGSASQNIGNLEVELAEGEELYETLVRYELTCKWMRVVMLTSIRRAKAAESRPAVSGSAEVELLRQRVTAIEARNATLESSYLDVYQDKLGIETALNDLKEHTDPEALSCQCQPSPEARMTDTDSRSHPFLHQREQLHMSQKEGKDKQEEILKLQAELAQVKATQDLNLNKEDEYKQLAIDIEKQRIENSSLNTKLDEHEALLRTALRNANALQNATNAQEQDYKLILSQLEAARDAPADESILPGTATKLAERLEEGREMVKEATKVTTQVHASELNDKTLFVLINSPRKPWVEHARNGSAPSMPAPPKAARRSWFCPSAKPKARPLSELGPVPVEPMASQAKLVNKTMTEQVKENKAKKRKSWFLSR